MRVFRVLVEKEGTKRYLQFALFLILLAGLCHPASAQLPAARLNTIFPPGGQAGSTVDVTFSGVDLDGAAEARFSVPGVTAKLLNSSDSDTGRKFSVTIPPDAPPGNYTARLVGRFGVSNSRTFAVGAVPELVAAAADTLPRHLPVDTVVSGRCVASALETFAVDLKQGQRVLIECASREIDSKLVPVMTLANASGVEIARSRRGGLIDFTALATGTYQLQLHDLLYKGGAEYFYRLCASTSPHLDSIFPPAGVPGSTTKFTLLGRNLPGGKLTSLLAADGHALEQLEVEITLPDDPSAVAPPDTLALLGPAGAGIDGMAYRLKSGRGLSNPVLIGFARAPVVVVAGGEASENPPKLSAPCEVVGRFYPHGHRDTFTFEAEKGGVYWIEILSGRLNQPTSPELLVQRVGKTDKGEQVSDIQDMGGPDMQPMGKRGGGASAGYAAPSRDIEYRLESKEGGTYRLTISDLFADSQDNATLVYRMLIHKQSPDFRLIATTAAPAPVNGNAVREPMILQPFLRKGGAVAIRVNCLRRDGFDGNVTVEAQGLPPGVHCAPATISGEDNATNLILLADENAAAWSGTIRVVGTANVAGNDVSRQARVGEIVWPTINPGQGSQERGTARLSSELPLAISADETEAVALSLDQREFAAKLDGTVHIPVHVTRRIELKQPLKITVAGLARSGSSGKVDLTLEADADSGTVDLDLASQRLLPGTYTFYLQAQAQIKYDRAGGVTEKIVDDQKKKKQPTDSLVTFYSPAITLKVQPVMPKQGN